MLGYDIIYKYSKIDFDSAFYSEFEELDEKDINQFIRYIYCVSITYIWHKTLPIYYYNGGDDELVLLADKIKELSEHYLYSY